MRKLFSFAAGVVVAAMTWSSTSTLAQDTFSIAAIDPVSGQVGSAGASCIAGCIILSDVHPGTGIIHTQSFWNAQNQQYARTLMNQGHAPEAIIDSLVAHDAQGNPTIRQYAIVDRVNDGRSAAYTGVNCFDYKNHILGGSYSIAGNILLGQQILDWMEAAFLAPADLFSDRLMAALQGANVSGADTRCLQHGKPAISAFIRVALPGDALGSYYLDLNVNNTPPEENPIDILQMLYDAWREIVSVSPHSPSIPLHTVLYPNHPNPFFSSTVFRYELEAPGHVMLGIYNAAGREVARVLDGPVAAGSHEVPWESGRSLPSGVYFYRLQVGPFSQTRPLVLVR